LTICARTSPRLLKPIAVALRAPGAVVVVALLGRPRASTAIRTGAPAERNDIDKIPNYDFS
jgi:hypothetical protein